MNIQFLYLLHLKKVPDGSREKVMTVHYLGQTGKDTNVASAWLKRWQAIKQCSKKRGQREQGRATSHFSVSQTKVHHFILFYLFLILHKYAFYSLGNGWNQIWLVLIIVEEESESSKAHRAFRKEKQFQKTRQWGIMRKKLRKEKARNHHRPWKRPGLQEMKGTWLLSRPSKPWSGSGSFTTRASERRIQ